MTFVPDRHLPTAEFRERLEHEVLRELGAPAAGLLPARRTRSFHRVGLRTVAVDATILGWIVTRTSSLRRARRFQNCDTNSMSPYQ